MTAIQEENCPACIVDRGQVVLLKAKETQEGYVWHCPFCGSEFTEEDLDQIYKTKDK